MSTSGGASGRLAILQAAAIDDTRMGASALRMLVTLGTYTDTDGWSWPKQRVLSERLGVSQQAVSRAIRDLASMGYIEVHDQFDPATGARMSSRYRIVLEFELPSEFCRTQQPEVVTPQLQVVAPTTSEVVAPTTSEVVAPTTSEVVAIKEERPIKNDPSERPESGGARKRSQGGVERELFDYYRQRIFPGARTWSVEKIHARLKTFSVDELRRGIDNFAADWWQMDNNATRGADWFFANDRRTEQYLHMVPRRERPSTAPAPSAPAPGSLAARTRGRTF